jgi:hypothetical protein
MTREDIVRMAREAGYNAQISNEHFGSICYISQDNSDSTLEKFNRLEDFAKLVAQHVRKSINDEAKAHLEELRNNFNAESAELRLHMWSKEKQA